MHQQQGSGNGDIMQKNNSKQTHSCKFLETGSRVSTA
jgi:hypothetical protein